MRACRGWLNRGGRRRRQGCAGGSADRVPTSRPRLARRRLPQALGGMPFGQILPITTTRFSPVCRPTDSRASTSRAKVSPLRGRRSNCLNGRRHQHSREARPHPCIRSEAPVAVRAPDRPGQGRVNERTSPRVSVDRRALRQARKVCPRRAINADHRDASGLQLGHGLSPLAQTTAAPWARTAARRG